jgi:outer membrane protein
MSPRLICTALMAAFTLSAHPAHGMDLLEAVKSAIEIDPLVTGAKFNELAVRERIVQARAGLLPSVNANAAGNFNVTNTTLTDQRFYDGQSVNLQANLPVYRPANNEVLAQSELNAQIARLQWLQAEQDLVVRVATAYFDVLAAQDSLAVVQAQKGAFSEQFESARRNFEVGTATITDQQEAQSRLDLTRAQEVAITNDLQVKKALLAQLTGKRVDQLNTLRQGIDVTAPDAAREGEWAQLAREQNFTVRQAELVAEIAKREIERQRAGHLPTLDLVSQVVAGRSTNAQTAANLVGVRNQFGTVGLQFALPIYQGGAVSARVREAISLQAKSEYDIESARRVAEQSARTTFLGVRSGIEQVRALTAAEKSSQLALESNQLGYQVGVRINIDVLNAAQQLFSTQRDLARARYDVLLNSLRLRNTTADLLEPEVARVNALLEPPRAPAVGVMRSGAPFPVGSSSGGAAGSTGSVPVDAKPTSPVDTGIRGGRGAVPRAPAR